MPIRAVSSAPGAKRVHKIKPASVEELAALTEAMPERLRLMVTLAYWCALRFGETVELRRSDIDLSADVIRIRRAAVRTKGGYTVTSPKSDAGIRDVDIPPHIIPAIEDHLSKYVDSSRDSLIFPADNGGHLQPSTRNRHWYRREKPLGAMTYARHDLRHTPQQSCADRRGWRDPCRADDPRGSLDTTGRDALPACRAGRGREIAALMSKPAITNDKG